MTTTTAITCSRRALVAAGALSVAALLAPARAALASGRGREGDSILSASHERGTLVEAAGLALTLPGSVEEGGADSWVVTRGRTSVEVSILSYLDYAGLLALSGEAASEGRDFEADVRAFVSTAEREGAWVESATRLNVEGLDADAFQAFVIRWEDEALGAGEWDLLFARDADGPVAVAQFYLYDDLDGARRLVDGICQSAELV